MSSGLAGSGQVDAETAARYVWHVTGKGCAQGTIRYWASRGLIARVGSAGRRALYSLAEIHRLITGEDFSQAA